MTMATPRFEIPPLLALAVACSPPSPAPAPEVTIASPEPIAAHEEPPPPAAPSAGGSPSPAPPPSCDAARSAAVAAAARSGRKPDISVDALKPLLSRGVFLNVCGVPATIAVDVCAAIQNGRATGVTVVTDPTDAEMQQCIGDRIRDQAFPAHPRLDITTVRFERGAP